jgi:malonyl-CoA O-methyltransferase
MASSVPTSAAARELDARAVQAIVRRLALGGEGPWLHREAARRMAERLPVIRKQPRAVLDWSGRLGASAEALRDAYPSARVALVEPWEALRPARRAAWWSPRRWSEAEVLTPAAVEAGAVQLLWSNMLLQAVDDPPALFEQWHRALAVDGFLMFSTLGPGTLPELRALYAQRHWGMPGAELIDMHDLGDMLVHAGFADPVMDQETLTLTFESAEAALAELRTLGGNAAPRRHAGLRTPRWRGALLQGLDTLRDSGGRIALRFELVYGHAFRPPAQARVQTRTEVSLDAMREMVRSGRKPPR